MNKSIAKSIIGFLILVMALPGMVSAVCAPTDPCYAPCGRLYIGMGTSVWMPCMDGINNESCTCDLGVPYENVSEDDLFYTVGTCIEGDLHPCQGGCNSESDCGSSCRCNHNMPLGYGIGKIFGTCVNQEKLNQNPCYAPCITTADCSGFEPAEALSTSEQIYCICDLSMEFNDGGFVAPGTCIETSVDPCYAPCVSDGNCSEGCICNMYIPYESTNQGTCVPISIPEFPLTAIPTGLALISYGLIRRRQ